MNVLKEFLSSSLAGIAIAIGCIVSMSVENRIVGAILFAIGIFIICVFGLSLFTGKVCYTLDNRFEYIPYLIIDWFGNFMGTSVVVTLISDTRLNPALIKKATNIVGAKLNDTYISLFILGILCSFCIFIGVENYKRNEHGILKALGLFIGIPVFILCGFEHCVADMFYFVMARADFLETIKRLLVITAGNSIGGIIIETAFDITSVPERW